MKRKLENPNLVDRKEKRQKITITFNNPSRVTEEKQSVDCKKDRPHIKFVFNNPSITKEKQPIEREKELPNIRVTLNNPSTPDEERQRYLNLLKKLVKINTSYCISDSAIKFYRTRIRQEKDQVSRNKIIQEMIDRGCNVYAFSSVFLQTCFLQAYANEPKNLRWALQLFEVAKETRMNAKDLIVWEKSLIKIQNDLLKIQDNIPFSELSNLLSEPLAYICHLKGGLRQQNFQPQLPVAATSPNPLKLSAEQRLPTVKSQERIANPSKTLATDSFFQATPVIDSPDYEQDPSDIYKW